MSAVLEIRPRDESYVAKVASLMNADEPDKAYAVLNEVLLRNPEDAQALCLASDIMKKCKRLPVAYILSKRAVELRPDRPEAWSSLGHAAQQMWRLDEAKSCYRKAQQRAKTKEQQLLYLNNLGSTYLDGGEFSKAEDYCRQGLAISDKDTNLRHNMGLSLLGQRKWAEAWPYYSASIGTERRLKIRYLNPQEATWDGSKDKTVVIYGEQGLGDEICAASMLPDAIRDCRKVIIDCDHRLENLFRRSFPEATVYGTRWKKSAPWPEVKQRTIEASTAAFELGQFYRNSDADFPGTAYLKPCPIRTGMWRKEFKQAGDKPLIGIAWSGGIWQNAAAFRELPLAQWQPIFDAVDANFVSLQYRDASKDIAGTKVQQFPWATLTNDYDDTAALVAACDLVIAVQTSVVHLAGALGTPCWSLIPKTSQWRYGENYTDLPWYRSVKLYRQVNEWPVKAIADDLRTHFR